MRERARGGTMKEDLIIGLALVMGIYIGWWFTMTHYTKGLKPFWKRESDVKEVESE